MSKSIFISALSLILTSNAFANETPPSYTANDALINVHNRCIVRLYDDLDSDHVTGLARAIAAQAGASLQHIYKHSIKGFAINMPCSAADAAFGHDPYVVSMEPDSVVSINRGKPPKDGGGDSTDTQRISYGTVRVGAASVSNTDKLVTYTNATSTVNGTGYRAWIIDTGIDLDHPDLEVAEYGFSAITTKGIPDMNDQNGHGTHVAGTIAAIDNGIGSLGVAPGATVVSVRVLDRRGSGTISGVIAGVEYVAANSKAGDCANMSLGGGISTSLDAAVIAAANAVDSSSGTPTGAFFAIAAGNSGDDAQYHSPARAGGGANNKVWTISAVDENDIMPSWSNWGDRVDYAAPGVSIFSLWKDGGTNTISGTSMAAPHACAVIMMSHPVVDGLAQADQDDEPDPIISIGSPRLYF